jgi:hypothetical protein
MTALAVICCALALAYGARRDAKHRLNEWRAQCGAHATPKDAM